MEGTQIKMLFLDAIRESPLNPRKNFFNLDELAEDLKRRGVLQPLMVRPQDKHYELIFGARRFRASKLAGLQQVPAIIREMEDGEALETMIVENGKRDDVHELEEASGYQMLRDRGYEVAAIAAKVSKDESYVYKRLKLLDLIQSAQDAFLKGEINAGHAIHLARLQPADQEKAFESIFMNQWGEKQKGKERQARSVKDLEHWISEHILLDLHSAPFKKDDENLLPEAGSCVKCHKRSGFAPQLFSDLAKKDTCTDPACHEAKLQAHIKRQIDKNLNLVQVTTDYQVRKPLSGDGSVLPASKYHQIRDKKDMCNSSRKALIVDGYNRAKLLDICTDPECKKHGQSLAGRSSDDRKWREQQRKQDLLRKKKRETRLRILQQACGIISYPYSRQELELMAIGFWDGLWDDARKTIASRRKWEKINYKNGFGLDHIAMLKTHLKEFTDVDLARFLMELSIARQLDGVDDYRNKSDRLLELAKIKGIDPKKIEKEVSAEFAEADKKRKAREKKRKASTKGSKQEEPPEQGDLEEDEDV